MKAKEENGGYQPWFPMWFSALIPSPSQRGSQSLWANDYGGKIIPYFRKVIRNLRNCYPRSDESC